MMKPIDGMDLEELNNERVTLLNEISELTRSQEKISSSLKEVTTAVEECKRILVSQRGADTIVINDHEYFYPTVENMSRVCADLSKRKGRLVRIEHEMERRLKNRTVE